MNMKTPIWVLTYDLVFPENPDKHWPEVHTYCYTSEREAWANLAWLDKVGGPGRYHVHQTWLNTEFIEHKF